MSYTLCLDQALPDNQLKKGAESFINISETGKKEQQKLKSEGIIKVLA